MAQLIKIGISFVCIVHNCIYVLFKTVEVVFSEILPMTNYSTPGSTSSEVEELNVVRSPGCH